jgi:ribonucleotide reductase beta subunit family protein with ferritin-like domain
LDDLKAYFDWYRQDQIANFHVFWSEEELRLYDDIQDYKRKLVEDGAKPAFRGHVFTIEQVLPCVESANSKLIISAAKISENPEMAIMRRKIRSSGCYNLLVRLIEL